MYHHLNSLSIALLGLIGFKTNTFPRLIQRSIRDFRRMASDTVKTRMFIISDTHSSPRKSSISQHNSFRQPFPKADVLIHTGDLTYHGSLDEYKSALELLALVPAELKLVIAGNHDLTLDKEYYEARQSTLLTMAPDYRRENSVLAEKMWIGEDALKAGVTYLTEGLHTFTLSNGAVFRVYASPWQPECKSLIMESLQSTHAT